jgi:GT2 family glycosyltransferase
VEIETLFSGVKGKWSSAGIGREFPDPQPKVYIILTNWNGYRDSIECLESLFRLHYPNFTVVLCDNDSADGSIRRLMDWAEGRTAYIPPPNELKKFTDPPLLKPISYRFLTGNKVPDAPCCTEPLILIQTGGNLGFAGGNNVGIRFALRQGDCYFIWLLNNDTIVGPDTLDHLVNRIRCDETVGMVGASICYYDRPDMLQALGGAKFNKYKGRSKFIGVGRRLSDIADDEAAGVEYQLDWVSGASMLLSMQFIRSIGLMDESYFLYFEELDWALRAGGRFRMAYAPKALVYHKHGSSTKEGAQSDTAIYYRYRSRLKLYRKLLPLYVPFCLVSILTEALVKIIKRNTLVLRPMWRAVTDELGGPVDSR